MTFGMYAVVALMLAPVITGVVLTIINYNDGSLDGSDFAMAVLIGTIASAAWVVSLSLLALAGIGYFLFKQFNSGLEKYMEKRK